MLRSRDRIWLPKSCLGLVSVFTGDSSWSDLI